MSLAREDLIRPVFTKFCKRSMAFIPGKASCIGGDADLADCFHTCKQYDTFCIFFKVEPACFRY